MSREDTSKQYAEIIQIGRQHGNGEEYDIQFELYDYVHDIRDILNGPHNAFENSWNIVFEVLQNHRLPNVTDKIDDTGIGQEYLKQKN